MKQNLSMQWQIKGVQRRIGLNFSRFHAVLGKNWPNDSLWPMH